MKRGFTLIELMVVVAIFTILFAATLYILTTQERSWRTGQDKLAVQQEARRAMDAMSRLIRQSNPDWVINILHYPVTITANNRIDFYQPGFDTIGNIITLKKITFKINPGNTAQLLKKEGISAAVVIANNLESVNFGGGCLGCSAFDCSSVATDCPVVTLTIGTRKNNIGFNLTSRISLRNANMAVNAATVVEEPPEGGF